jgi:RND family efflux transporter MFP subunit
MHFRGNRLLAFVTFALSLGLLCCGRTPQEISAAAPEPPPLHVKVKRADPQPVPQFAEYIATLKSRSSASLKSEVEGQVTRIAVKSGDSVDAGTALLEIDPLKQQATVNSQEANHRSRLASLEWNRTELERRQKLYAAGVISKQELDQQQTAYDAAKADADSMEASVREQRVQLRYYVVKAPSAGVIGDIPVRVGDRVTVATELTTIDKTGELEAYLSIPAEKSSAVKIGTPVQIVEDDGSLGVRAAITFISPRVDPTTQLLLVKATILNRNHRYRNNQLVHTRVIYSETQQFLIPVTAIVRLSGQAFAYVAESNGKMTVAKQRPVVLGDVIGNDYVVLNGIKPGELMIVSGTQMLGDGAPVSPES